MTDARDMDARREAEARVREIFRPAREALAQALAETQAARVRMARDLQRYGR